MVTSLSRLSGVVVVEAVGAVVVALSGSLSTTVYKWMDTSVATERMGVEPAAEEVVAPCSSRHNSYR